MGDRCIIALHKNGRPQFAALYLHWAGGEGAQAILEAAAPYMRAGDMGYALARLVGAACAYHPNSAFSVGIVKGPKSLNPDHLRLYSHGNAGVILIDIDTGRWTGHAGYLEGETGNLALFGLETGQ
jgi:hypothetical protein